MPRYSSDFFFSPRPTKQRRKNDREREQREIELAISLSLLTRSPLPLFSFSLSSHGDVVSSHALGVAAFCAARSSSGSSSSAPPALEDGRGTAALDGDGADAAARRIRAPPGPLRRRRERRAEPALQLQGSRGVPRGLRGRAGALRAGTVRVFFPVYLDWWWWSSFRCWPGSIFSTLVQPFAQKRRERSSALALSTHLQAVSQSA